MKLTHTMIACSALTLFPINSESHHDSRADCHHFMALYIKHVVINIASNQDVGYKSRVTCLVKVIPYLSLNFVPQFKHQ